MNNIFAYWQVDFWTTFILVILSVCYLFAVKFRLSKRSVWFAAGLFLMAICFFSPLHFLAAHYLFSAHMVVHVVLLLIVAPMFVAALPPMQSAARPQNLSFSKIRNPVIYWFTGVGIMWFWHIPVIFNQMKVGHSTVIMEVQTLSLILAGMVFSLPVIGPQKQRRLAPLQAVLYLSLACVFCSLLGLMITFSPVGTFTPYLNPMDHFGLLPLVRGKWNISVGADQQAAGLIMWVPCCFVYLTASMVLLIKWFDAKSPVARRKYEQIIF